MSESKKKFSGKLRVRACGVLVENDQVLLIQHRNLGPKGVLWAPPGGGVSFHESVEAAIKREFQEETGLSVSVGQFLFINEYMDEWYHAIELFFEVKRKSGKVKLGTDPELPKENQQLMEIAWFSTNDIKKMDLNELHNAFKPIAGGQTIKDLKGFFKFENISVK